MKEGEEVRLVVLVSTDMLIVVVQAEVESATSHHLLVEKTEKMIKMIGRRIEKEREVMIIETGVSVEREEAGEMITMRITAGGLVPIEDMKEKMKKEEGVEERQMGVESLR